jgi:hypothetical protein
VNGLAHRSAAPYSGKDFLAFAERSSRAIMVPANPRIYHITHLENLPSIIQAGCLWSDAQRVRQGFSTTNIGHQHIKQRRLARSVPVAAGGTLGEYVPFNFCPRSVMLYVVHRGHQDYPGGQARVIHLVSSVQTAVATERPWAFTDRHADLAYANYYTDLARLDVIDWDVMPREQWGGDPALKERRQAEFLVHEWFPWTAVEQIGVQCPEVANELGSILSAQAHRPPVAVEPLWYY